MKPTVAVACAGICRSVRVRALLVPLAFVFCAAPPAAAQIRIETSPGVTARRAAPDAVPIIDTLGKALDLVTWNEETAGPLIALDPQNVRPWQPAPAPNATHEERFRPPQPLPPLTNGRTAYRLNVVAPFFGRKIVRAGSLTVLAPTTMIVLNDRPGRGDPLAGMRRDERMRYFASLLSRDQWRRLASPQGLGAGDLDPDQRALFLSLLPDPFRLQRVRDEPGGGQRYLENGKVTLTPGQRAQVRLRVNRSLQMLHPLVGQPNSYTSTGQPPRALGGEGEDVSRFIVEYSGEYGGNPDAYGVTLRRELPNRLKTGHLDFDAPALQGAVSLLPPGNRDGDGDNAPAAAPAATKPLTVAELCGRVSQAAGMEIMADRRVAGLSVWTRGESARAGDVLRALCWAVTGTFRRVGSLYLLTDDVEGIGARRARIADWAREVSMRGNKQRQTLDKRVRDMQPGKFLDFAPGDTLALDADALKMIRDRQRAPRKPGAPNPSEIPLSDLPPGLAQIARDQATALQAQRSGDGVGIRTDRVRLDVQTRVSYLVPEAGALEAQGMYLYNIPALPEDDPNTPGPPSEPPPVVFPAHMAARILYVAPATPAEARTAARAARARGLTHLWVNVPGDEPAGKTLLTAAVQAGRAEGLLVFGVVPLLRRPLLAAAPAVSPEEDAAPVASEDAAVPADASSPLPRSGSDDVSLDLTVQGETGAAWSRRRFRLPDAQEPWTRVPLIHTAGDWLRPDAPATFERVKTRLLDLSATPGLTGLVLTGTAAPGYADPGQPNRGGYWTPGDERDFGYTPANRFAFLRQESIDPIDLVGSSSYAGNADLNLPFFSENAFQPRYVEVDGQWMPEPGAQSPVQKWQAFRYQQNVALLTRLHETVRAARPNLAVLVRSRPEGAFGPEGWFGTWDKPAALPQLTNPDFGPSGAVKIAQAARTFSRRVFLGAPFLDFSAPGAAGMDAQKIYAGTLGYLIKRHKAAGWDGIVFDLSGGPLEKMLPALAALDPQP